MTAPRPTSSLMLWATLSSTSCRSSSDSPPLEDSDQTPSLLPLYGFIFLVALAIDYTIFLMTRVREEAPAAGTREGMRRSLVSTGGVITSAGLVLAATFAALFVIPIQFLVQLAIIISLGVLIDTFIVRTFLVPSIVELIGRRVWWPSRLSRKSGSATTDTSA